MNKGEGMESVAGRGTLVINIDWNVEQREGAEEDHHVKILLESLHGENTLNDSFNFEELSSFVKGVSEATQDSDSLVSTHGGLRALLATDKIAGFERLISQYGKLFHQIAYNVLYSYDLAQDAVSEAYTKIYYYWLKDAEASEILSINLLPYLCRIVLNASLTCLEKEKTQRLRKHQKNQELIIDQRRRFETPDEVLERDEEKRIIHEEMARLPAKYRKAIQLRYLLDEDSLGSLSEIESERYAQLAAFTGVNEATLRSHVCRGKSLLKKRLRERGINH